MPDTVTCYRCSRTVPWTEQHWNALQNCCTTCAPQPTQSSETASAPIARGGIGMRVTGLDVPFGDLVMFMIKLTFASIPAGLLLAVLYFVLITLLGYER